MDARFALSVSGEHIPVAVTVINYEGYRLIDTLCCPREKITSYETRHHGLTEKELRGQQDSVEVIQEINELVEDKIIVGSDLSMEIRGLKINSAGI